MAFATYAVGPGDIRYAPSSERYTPQQEEEYFDHLRAIGSVSFMLAQRVIHRNFERIDSHGEVRTKGLKLFRNFRLMVNRGVPADTTPGKRVYGLWVPPDRMAELNLAEPTTKRFPSKGNDLVGALVALPVAHKGPLKVGDKVYVPEPGEYVPLRIYVLEVAQFVGGVAVRRWGESWSSSKGAPELLGEQIDYQLENGEPEPLRKPEEPFQRLFVPQ